MRAISSTSCLLLAGVERTCYSPFVLLRDSTWTGTRVLGLSFFGDLHPKADGEFDPTACYIGVRPVTVAFWSKRTYSTAGGHTLLESTTDFTQSTTGFALFPDDSACAGIQAAIKGDLGETANCYGQPTSGVWHHFALVFGKTQSAGVQVALYLDGVLQSPTRSLAASTNTNDFGNNSRLFSQGGTTMFDSGQLDDLRIYKTALTAADIQQIYRSAALLSLAVSPASVSIPSGTAQRFTATGTYADGSRRDLTNWVTWSSFCNCKTGPYRQPRCRLKSSS